MNPNNQPINGWSVFAYIVLPATVLAVICSAGPALAGNPALTKSLGLTGLLVGAIIGGVIGVVRRFR